MKIGAIIGLGAVTALVGVFMSKSSAAAGTPGTTPSSNAPVGGSSEGESNYWTESGQEPVVISSPGASTGGVPVVDAGLPGYYTPVAGGYAAIYNDPSVYSTKENALEYSQYIGNPEALEYYLERVEEKFG
jgi:hypothetical protein